MGTATTSQDWWESLQPDSRVWRQGRLGHLVLSVQREGPEWMVHSEHVPERNKIASWQELGTVSAETLAGAGRFLFDGPAEALELRPALADRPVIARPRNPITVPIGHRATVYVGTPLWVQLLQSGHREVLAEVSAERLSLTWFGETMKVGEVCYSTATSARLHLENFPPLPDYAITRVTLRNDGAAPLRFTQIKLPVATLSLLRNEAGQHFTEPVRMTQTDGGMTKIDVQAPAAGDELFEGLTPASAARQTKNDRNLVESAFDRLFR
ncbi:MAG: hypothetical protein AAGA81_25005 [Acidobacteriota bacterium]